MLDEFMSARALALALVGRLLATAAAAAAVAAAAAAAVAVVAVVGRR